MTRDEHPEDYGSGVDLEDGAGSSKSARGSVKRPSFGDESGKDVDLEFDADQSSLSYARSERTVREEEIGMESLEGSGKKREKKKTMQIKVEVEDLSEAIEVELVKGRRVYR